MWVEWARHGCEAWSEAASETTGFFENRRSLGGFREERHSTFVASVSHISFYISPGLKLQTNKTIYNLH